MVVTYKFDVASAVEEKVLWFKIAIDDVSRVQIVERLDHARRVECGSGFVKVTSITKDRPQFAAKTSFHEHVDKLVITVRVVEAGDERTAARHHYVLLAINVLLLQCVDNVLLLEALEGEGL